VKNDSPQSACSDNVGMLSNRLCDDDAFQRVTKTIRIVIAGSAPNDRRCILLYASLLGREDIRGLLILIARRSARSWLRKSRKIEFRKLVLPQID
jgi:hypothetical protein